MAIKLFGKIHLEDNNWVISEAQAHVCLKLKSIFPRINKSTSVPFTFPFTMESSADLLWFMQRYPLQIPDKDMIAMEFAVKQYALMSEKMESILLDTYEPRDVRLKDGIPRHYQLQAADLHAQTKRLLLGDDLGLGKTLSAILTLLKPGTLPALVVVQTHLAKQWGDEIIRFTNLRVHIIKGTKPYSLPKADVYIMKYSCLSGWSDMYGSGFWKSAIFDEVQELRICGSQKYQAAEILSQNVEFCLGMSATPVYNFGDEIFNVVDLIKPGCLGERYDFLREWAVLRGMNKFMIRDPQALGTYLRDNYLFLRRTRAEVGRELPAINKIIHYVGYDSAETKKSENLARTLALKIVSGSFLERGKAALELDLMVRQLTGVSKAREVAEYVKILLENNEPVVLAGWHREVYEIWKEALAEYKPVFYTGTESPTQKEAAKQAFIAGETNLFIISLRSGIGLDGLQKRCKTVVVGELDWSPKVHDQLIARVDRDGQQEQVTAIFLVSEYGSDPVVIDLLGLKSSQSHGIVDPLTAPVASVNDESRIKKLAERFLHKNQQN